MKKSTLAPSKSIETKYTTWDIPGGIVFDFSINEFELYIIAMKDQEKNIHWCPNTSGYSFC